MNTFPDLATATAVDSKLQDGLHAVLSGILVSANDEARRAYEAVADDTSLEDAVACVQQGDASGFRRVLLGPFDQVVEGLLNTVAPGRPELKFLFQENRFVERQVRAVIEDHEGSACVGDKTRFVMAALARYWLKGTPIVVDRTQQYTFHLPSKVLVDQAGILAFFGVVRQLYHGQSAPFVRWLAAHPVA